VSTSRGTPFHDLVLNLACVFSVVWSPLAFLYSVLLFIPRMVTAVSTSPLFFPLMTPSYLHSSFWAVVAVRVFFAADHVPFCFPGTVFLRHPVMLLSSFLFPNVLFHRPPLSIFYVPLDFFAV